MLRGYWRDLAFIAVCIAVLSLGSFAFAQYLEDEPITDVETRRVREAPRLYILSGEKRIVVKPQWNYLNANGDILRSEPSKVIERIDREDNLETPEDETLTEYTVFMQELGLTKAKLINALQVSNQR